MTIDMTADSPEGPSQDYDGSYTEEIKNFPSLTEKFNSAQFEIGGYVWDFLIFPRGNPNQKKVERSLSIYLNAPNVVNNEEIPDKKYARAARFQLSLLNVDPAKTVRKDTTHIFTRREMDWGFSELLKLQTVLEPGSGFLDEQGTLRVRVDVKVLYGPDYPGYDPRKETGFVGITNQGATCYLNSLLQTLFHLPAFRRAVYKIPTSEDEDATSSIPLALQRFFFRLQYADDAADTRELTKTFGWDSYEAFQQHDVQELARVLIDKLEEKMKNTPVEKDFKHLMEGKTVNTTQCKHVDFKSERDETFLDLQLMVKGSSGVYQSFDQMVEAEEMSGENKYDAEKFGLQDALRFTKIKSCPPVLFLHLKRFDFDYQTMQQFKINDRFEFPANLDLDRDTRKLFHESADTAVRNYYKLFSVLVHMGSNHGGHYFAYINPTGKQWLKFDDDKVVKVPDQEAIESQLGSTEGRGVARGSNAYMLVYVRESDWPKVFCDAGEGDLPEHLQATLRGQLEKEKRENADREEAHLYANVAVLREGDLKASVEARVFGLAEASISARQRRLRSNLPFWEMVRGMEAECGVPAAQHRYWLLDNRDTGNWRPCVPLPSSRYGELLDQIGRRSKHAAASTATTELFVYLEELPPEQAGAAYDLQDMALLFFKWFEPGTSTLTYFTHMLVPTSATVAVVERELLRRRGLPETSRLAVYEEAMDPSLRTFRQPNAEVVVRLKGTEKLANINAKSGDVFIVQLVSKEPGETVETFIERKINECKVTFQRLEDSRENVVRLDMMTTDTYPQIAGRLAQRLGLESWEYVRLYPQHQWMQKASRNHVVSGETRNLRQLFEQSTFVPNFFFYEVLTMPLSKLEQMRSVSVSYVNERGEFEREVEVQLHQAENMQALMAEAARRLSLQGPLRLLCVSQHRVHHVVDPKEQLKEVKNLWQWQYRLEPLPEGESMEELRAIKRMLVNVCHCVRVQRVGMDLDFWGEPLLVPVGASDTLDSIRARVLAKMGVTDPGAQSWKWFLWQMGKAEELMANQPLGDRLMRMSDLSDISLAVEHPDTRPHSKRRENYRPGYGRADGGIRIG